MGCEPVPQLSHRCGTNGRGLARQCTHETHGLASAGETAGTGIPTCPAYDGFVSARCHADGHGHRHGRPAGRDVGGRAQRGAAPARVEHLERAGRPAAPRPAAAPRERGRLLPVVASPRHRAAAPGGDPGPARRAVRASRRAARPGLRPAPTGAGRRPPRSARVQSAVVRAHRAVPGPAGPQHVVSSGYRSRVTVTTPCRPEPARISTVGPSSTSR